jgi:hypothetical protein
LSCSDWRRGVVLFRLKERSCLVQTGERSCLVQIWREELSCSDWKIGGVLFRLAERSCLVQTWGEELSCSDWKTGDVCSEESPYSDWRRIRIRINERVSGCFPGETEHEEMCC